MLTKTKQYNITILQNDHLFIYFMKFNSLFPT